MKSKIPNRLTLFALLLGNKLWKSVLTLAHATGMVSTILEKAKKFQWNSCVFLVGNCTSFEVLLKYFSTSYQIGRGKNIPKSRKSWNPAANYRN